MLKKIFLRSIRYRVFILFIINILLPGMTILASDVSYNKNTIPTNNQIIQTPQIVPNVILSLSTKDQEDLSKLFDHSSYEDFLAQQPAVGFSISDFTNDNDSIIEKSR